MAGAYYRNKYRNKKDDEEISFGCWMIHRNCADNSQKSGCTPKCYRKIGWLSMEAHELEKSIVSILNCTPFTNDETITCITGSTTDFFIGTSLGNIFHAKSTSSEFNFFGVTHVDDGPILQAEFLSAQEVLLVLVSEKLVELSVASTNYFSVLLDLNGVSKFAINKYPIYKDDADPFCVQIAIAFNNIVHIFEKVPGKFTKTSLQKITASDAIVDLTFAGNNVFYATKDAYYRHNIKKNATLRECETFTPVEKDDVHLPSSNEERQKNTQICTVTPHKFVMFRTGNALVCNLDAENTVMKYQDGCVLSSCSKSSDVYVVSKNTITIYGENGQVDSFFPNDSHYKLITNIEGQILVCNDNQVFNVRKHSTLAKLSSLVEMGLYEQALVIAQKELRTTKQNEEVQRAVHSLKRAIGFQKLKEKKEIVLAFNYLMEAKVDPLEVISNIDSETVLTHQFLTKKDMDVPRQLVTLVSCLREYLVEVKKSDFVDDEQRKKISLQQMRFQFQDDIEQWENDYGPLTRENLDPDVEKKIWIHAASIALDNRNLDEVLNCWTMALPDVEMSDIENALKILNDDRRSKVIIEWVMVNKPHHAIELIDKHLPSTVSLIERSTLLETHPKVHLEWLSQHFESSYTLRETYLKVWCNLMKDASIDDPLIHDFRLALVQFPQKNLHIDENTMAFLQNPNFLLEQKLIVKNPKLNDAKTILTTLLGQNDYETAEAYLELHFKKYPELFAFFFEYYRKLPNVNYASKLKEYMNKTDDLTVLAKILEMISSVKIEEVSALLNPKITRSLDEHVNKAIVKSCQNVLINSNAARPANKPIRINENGRCDACHKEFDLSNDSIAYLPTGCLVHNNCIRHPGLCPVTNIVFCP